MVASGTPGVVAQTWSNVHCMNENRICIIESLRTQPQNRQPSSMSISRMAVSSLSPLLECPAKPDDLLKQKRQEGRLSTTPSWFNVGNALWSVHITSERQHRHAGKSGDQEISILKLFAVTTEPATLNGDASNLRSCVHCCSSDLSSTLTDISIQRDKPPAPAAAELLKQGHAIPAEWALF